MRVRVRVRVGVRVRVRVRVRFRVVRAVLLWRPRPPLRRRPRGATRRPWASRDLVRVGLRGRGRGRG